MGINSMCTPRSVDHMMGLAQTNILLGYVRRGALVGTVVCSAMVAPVYVLKAQVAKDQSLDAIAFLEGAWRGEGKWPDGSALKVEVLYTWGPTKRVLHFQTQDVSGAAPRLLYEGLLVLDPKRGAIVQWNFKPSGEIDTSELTRVNSSGFDVRSANTRSVVRRSGPNEFEWQLLVPRDTTWHQILVARHRRLKR